MEETPFRATRGNMLGQYLAKMAYMVLYVLSFNLFFLTATGILVYRTVALGRFNLALFMLVISFFLINICRAIARYNDDATVSFIYKLLVLASFGLFITSIGVQTVRFINVFIPTLTAFTLPKILVRVGVTTAVFYVYALIVTFVYYLYANDMLDAIWNGSVERFLNQSILRDKGPNKWRQGQFASRAFIFIFFWGGFASLLTLTIGLFAWLIR